MHKILLRPLVLLIAIASLVSDIRADERPADAKAQEKVNAIFRGLQDERDKLVCGICRVKGKKVAHSVGEGANPDVDGETSSLLAFDFAKGLFRYDNDEPAYRGRISADDFKTAAGDKEAFAKLMKSTKQDLVTLKLRYIKNADYVARWFSNSDKDTNSLHLFKPDEPELGRDLARSHHFFDIRACGLLDYAQFSSAGMPASKFVGDYCAVLQRLSVVSVTKTIGKTLVLQDKKWTRQLTIDTANGFCAVDYIVVSRDEPPTLSVSQVKWKRVSDVWVPKSLFIRHVEPDGSQIRYAFEYTWESVNKPLDASYFDYKSFTDIPDDVRVTDTRPDDD